MNVVNRGRWTIFSQHETDVDGNPAGGQTETENVGVSIIWQNGPLNVAGHNGAFVEEGILSVIDRLHFYQNSKYKCQENQNALIHLGAALHCLEERTKDRIERGVEGLHEV